MTFKEKKLSTIHLFKGLTMVKTLEDLMNNEELGILFTAIYLSDDETLKKYRKDPEALNPYILQAEQMEADEVGEVISFFIQKVIAFSQIIQKGVAIQLQTQSLKKK